VCEKLCTSAEYFLKLSAIYRACAHHLSDGKMQENGYLLCAQSAGGNMT